MAYLDRVRVVVLVENSARFASPYLGLHGTAFFVEAYRGGARLGVLVDVGQNPDALLYNMKVLGVSPAAVDAIVLTHCHYDHTKGVSAVLKAIGKRGVPVVAHPDIFRPNFVAEPYLRYVGVDVDDSRERIVESGGALILSKDPVQLMPGLLTSGEVRKRVDFENVKSPFRTVSSDGRVVEDDMRDEIAVIANVRNEGLVIITSCSHPGICSIVKQAIELTGVKKVKAIIGGLHLVEASEERIRKTVEFLAQQDIDLIAAGHCTGFKAQVELYLKFKERFTPLYTGMVFTF
jgi:7,8-dihydropterin-6-yl-methyl-4-(beta-D-ribofuranosyl)aminobenzene 5'-phosphate synthase